MRMLLPCLLAALLVPLAGCTTPKRQVVYSKDFIEVSTRRVTDARGATGFEHPAAVELEPLALALAEIRVGDLDSLDVETRRAIHLDIVAGIARGLVAGFAEAAPDEELVVMATRKEKTVGIFHRRSYTSFVAYRKDGALVLDFTYTDKRLTKAEERQDLPPPRIGQRRMKFRVLEGEGEPARNTQVARLAWPEATAPPPPVAAEGAPQDAAPEIPVDASVEAEAGLPEPLRRELRELDEALARGEIAERYHARKRAELLREADSDTPAGTANEATGNDATNDR